MISKNELGQMYLVDKMSQREIAKVTNVGQSTIRRHMNKHGIKSRTISESRTLLESRSMISQKPSKEKLEEMYIKQKMTMLEISELTGVCVQTVSSWIHIYNIESRTRLEFIGTATKPSKKELEKMYLVKKMTLTEIAQKTGVCIATIYNWIKEYDIKLHKNPEFQKKESNPNWNGGTSFLPYCNKFNHGFKESIRMRDDYTCQLCGYKQKLNDYKLSVHHIHYKKEDCYPDCIALCRSCHNKVHVNRGYWEEFFEKQMHENGTLCWSINLI